MSDKFYIGAILFLSFVVGVLYWLNNNAVDKIDELTTKLALKEANNAVVASNLETCNAKIELANTSLKALSVPKQNEAKIKERVITRVERVAVPIKDAACEEKLNFYERLLNEASNK
ncbi:hypothetical protein [Campylobacter concisus]|jgi:hypothetical protein|uniref:hypothetical protein n=1 Tax=Campylobacter concisus TaxID=199 RepID=UPI000CD87B33|nr:hypothetical protein [Campylobacter concisus]